MIALALLTLAQVSLPQASPTPPPSSFYWFDLDGDGDQDALAIEPGGSVRLLRNQGAGSFADDTLAAGLAEVVGAKSALIGDYDLDGSEDLVLAGEAGVRLLRQAGGVFVEVTSSAGLGDLGPVASAGWVDANGDRRPDLHLIGWGSHRVFANEAAGLFRELDLGASGTEPAGVVVSAGSGARMAEGGPLAVGRKADERTPREKDRGAPGRSVTSTASPTSAATDPAPITGGTPGSGGGGVDVAFCPSGINDQAVGTCVFASSVPTLGMLYPLGNEFSIDAVTGNVGVGTTTPGYALEVAGQIVSGTSNTAAGLESAMGGGKLNAASGNQSTIAGGESNAATAPGAFVGGGFSNSALSNHAAIAGGVGNRATYRAFVGGGDNNAATGNLSVVAGGKLNEARQPGDFVGGGERNVVDAPYAAVVGGANNSGTGDFSFLGGGGHDTDPLRGNTITGDWSAIVGGSENTITNSSWSIIGGGRNNDMAGTLVGYNVIGGGQDNQVTGLLSFHTTIGGGERNVVSLQYSTVGGGADNEASASSATVAGGAENLASATGATVAGGGNNTASGPYSFVGGGGDASNPLNGNLAGGVAATVGGGQNNSASGDQAMIGGGYNNDASGIQTTVGGGKGNQATEVFATVSGGLNNEAHGAASSVGGGLTNRIDAAAHYATIGGGDGNYASGYSASIGGGDSNTADGSDATVPGGFNNAATGDYSFAAGQNANANHDGSFVWSDSTGSFGSTAPDQFLIDASGGVGIGTVPAPSFQLDVAGAIRASDTFVSTTALGAPFAVTSSQLNTNLNADLLDGLDASAFSQIGASWTPISSLPFVITTPGAYYLTGNLSDNSGDHGIEIQVDDVTIDLNGFILSGDPNGNSGGRSGIDAATWSGVTVRNGIVRNWNDLGVDLGSGATVMDVRVFNNKKEGIYVREGVVKRCVARDNDLGIVVDIGTIADCTAASQNDLGFEVRVAGSVTRCSASDNSVGFQVLSAEVSRCSAENNNQEGFLARKSLLVNNVASNNQTGIRCEDQSRADGNHLLDNLYGVDSDNNENLIIRNSVSGSGFPYTVGPNDAFGGVISGGGVITTLSNWANFEQ
jgi:hypothetical protein